MIEMIEMIGFLGALGIAISWIPQTIRTFKTKKTGLDLRFNMIYVAASLLLTIYSFMIDDLVFIVLNLFATSLSSFNLYYSVLSCKRRLKCTQKR